MPGLKDMLTEAGFSVVPTETGKWHTILDRRPEFKKQFRTDRVGKILNDELYVTVGDLDLTARNLITSMRVPVLELKSTDGLRNRVYPGFRVAECADEVLQQFIQNLKTEADSRFTASD